MAAHLVHMVFYTNYCMDIASTAFAANSTVRDTREPNYMYILWPTIMVSTLLQNVFNFAKNVHTLRKQGRGRSIGNWILISNETKELIESKDFFQIPKFLLSLISACIPFICPVVFFFMTLFSLLTATLDKTVFSYTISISILVGWLMTFYWASAFEPVYRFLTALKFIILNDILSFLIFYIFVLLAFSGAIYVLFQMSPELSTQFPSYGVILHDMLLLISPAAGEAQITAADVRDKLQQASIDPKLFDALFIIYIIVNGWLFIGMITSTMVSTYTDLGKTEQYGWRQHSLKISKASYARNLIADLILHPLFKNMKIVDRNLEHEESKDFRHYYMILPEDCISQ